MLQSIALRKPDDFHLHLREGTLLEAVLPYSAQTFARTLVMPNLAKPILNAQRACAYKEEIVQTLQRIRHPSNTPSPFCPLMTIFLTEETTLNDFWLDSSDEATFPPLRRNVFGGKLYFATATTNTTHGVKNLSQLFPLFEQMEKHNLPLSIHGEIADETTDVFVYRYMELVWRCEDDDVLLFSLLPAPRHPLCPLLCAVGDGERGSVGVGSFDEGDAFFVERKVMEGGGVFGGESFEASQRGSSFGLKGCEDALYSVGSVEDAGATAGGLFLRARVRRGVCS